MNPAPWAYVPRETNPLKCHECGIDGTTSARTALIPQEREHDGCRAIAKARRDARGVAKKISRRNAA